MAVTNALISKSLIQWFSAYDRKSGKATDMQ